MQKLGILIALLLLFILTDVCSAGPLSRKRSHEYECSVTATLLSQQKSPTSSPQPMTYSQSTTCMVMYSQPTYYQSSVPTQQFQYANTWSACSSGNCGTSVGFGRGRR